MKEEPDFDFWYAVNHTELVALPSSTLETFGDTIVNYTLIYEQMDAADKICVREGQLKALKPVIITPQSMGNMDLENFGEEAQAYADWLKEHAANLRILQYGFTLQKEELQEHVITDQLENVVERVKEEQQRNDDPLSAILTGVEKPWEVCLLKLMVELVQRSAQTNMKAIDKQALQAKKSFYDQIDQAFAAASRDANKINALAELLKRKGIWEQYEDRFFALVKGSQR